MGLIRAQGFGYRFLTAPRLGRTALKESGFINTIWTIKQFSALSLDDLYDLICLRVDVFVVEQACPYSELDGKDRLAETRHIWTRDLENQMVACARILPPGPGGVSIGRVAVSQAVRGRGLAHDLLARALAQAKRLWPNTPVKIAAQAYLEGFYRTHGFVSVSPVYLEDNIPHIDMVLSQG